MWEIDEASYSTPCFRKGLIETSKSEISKSLNSIRRNRQRRIPAKVRGRILSPPDNPHRVERHFYTIIFSSFSRAVLSLVSFFFIKNLRGADMLEFIVFVLSVVAVVQIAKTRNLNRRYTQLNKDIKSLRESHEEMVSSLMTGSGRGGARTRNAPARLASSLARSKAQLFPTGSFYSERNACFRIERGCSCGNPLRSESRYSDSFSSTPHRVDSNTSRTSQNATPSTASSAASEEANRVGTLDRSSRRRLTGRDRARDRCFSLFSIFGGERIH